MHRGAVVGWGAAGHTLPLVPGMHTCACSEHSHQISRYGCSPAHPSSCGLTCCSARSSACAHAPGLCCGGADVVGITNYIDVGFQMVTDMWGEREPSMRLGASWQVGAVCSTPHHA